LGGYGDVVAGDFFGGKDGDGAGGLASLWGCCWGDDAVEKGAVGRDDGEPGLVGEIGGRDVAEFRPGA